MSKKYKWGILGPGKIASKFCEDLITIEHAEVYAVGSRNLEKSKEFGERFGASKTYGSYQELADDPDIDVIYVATPHVFHYDHTMLCLRHGKHVLCEKPFGMDRDQVEEMIECAQSNGVFLMEAMWTMFLPHYRYALDAINRGRHGKVISIEADFGFKAKQDPEHRVWNKDLGGGSLLDIGIYPVFAALTTIGYPDVIQAIASFTDQGVDREMKALFKYNSNQTALLRSSLMATTPTEAIIYLDHATIKINGRFHEPSSISIISDDGVQNESFYNDSNGYKYEALHVMECLDKGLTESELMSWDKSLQLISLLDEIRIQIGLSY